MNRKGSVAIIIILVVIIVAVIAGYFVWKHIETAHAPVATENVPVVASSTTTNVVTTTSEPADWETYTNQQYGFSVRYPAYLYVATSTCRGVTVCIQSANEDMELGGGIPDSGTFVTTGYQFIFDVEPASETFDINTYLANNYIYDDLATLSSTTIDGHMAYTFTFKDEEGGGNPTTVIPNGNEIISVAYSSRTDDTTFSSSTALFNQVISTLQFLR